jgi:DNA-binding beta-propeller fold protein YncE
VEFAGSTYDESAVLSPDGSRVYQLSSAGGFAQTVTAIDTATSTIAGTPLILTGGSPVGGLVMSADGSRLVLTTQTPNLADGNPQTVYVSVIDTADTSLLNRLTLTGFTTSGVVMNPDGTAAAQSVNLNSTAVTTYIDLIDGSVAWTATADGYTAYSTDAPIFSANGSRLSLVTERNSAPQVTVFDTSNGDVIGTLTLAGNTTGETTALVPDLTGNRLYVASGAFAGPTSITVIDTSDGTVVGDPLSVSGFGRLVASADDSDVYLTADDMFVVINHDGTVTGQANVPGGIGAVLVGPAGRPVYLVTSNGEQRQVIAVDPVTAATLGGPVPVDGYLFSSLVLNPAGTKIYDTNAVANTQPNFWSLLTSSYVTRLTVIDTDAM